MSVTRFPKGISTAPTGSNPLTQFGAPDPTKYIYFFDDFTGVATSFPVAASGLGSADTANWAIVVTEGGSGDAASSYVDGSGGILQIVTDTADNDQVQVQGKPEIWVPAAGKKAWFKAKLSITDANANATSIAQVEWYAGMIVTDTDVLSATAGDGVTDGIFFMSEDGTQDIYLHCMNNTTTGQKSTLLTDTLTVATMTEFAWYYDGARSIEVFVDGVKKTTVDLGDTVATYLPGEAVAVSFGIKNGEAVAKTLQVDYLMFAAER